MALVVDWFGQTIQVTSPTVEVDAQTLHDFIEDAMASPEGLTHEDILSPEGKIEDPNNPGVFSQIILVFNSPWQVQFWAGSGYTRIFGGKLVGGLGGQVMKATGSAGDITVLESPVDGVTVATSGALVPADVADAVWEKILEGPVTAEQAMRLLLSILTANGTVPSSGSFAFRDLADTKDRVVGSVSGTARVVTTRDGT